VRRNASATIDNRLVFGWSRPLPVPSSAERRLRGRALAALWTIGAALVLGSVLLPDSSVSDEPQVFVVAGVAVVFGAAMWLGSGHVPRWMFDVTLAVGSLLLALLVEATGPQSPYVLLFVWQLVFAAYFLPAPRAAIQAAVAATALTAGLTAAGTDFPWVRWGMAVATFAVVTGLVAALRSHVDRLLAAVQASARTDPLTGVLNRGGFDEAFDLERRRAARSGRPLSLIVCDVDRFKEVNDEFGHPVGDRALQRVAAALRRSARDIDRIARLGGEEFAILLPETDAEAAFRVAERMRAAISAEPSREGVRLTASFGVSECHADGDGLTAADAALYEAKAAGRDRTELAR
jgi:diguanylate cyclase (GGDEF)-like protein